MRILRVLSGPAQGQFLLVDSEVTVGRHEATLTIDDPELSRRHTTLRPADGGVVVEDLRSTNGTFVDGRRIDQPVLLTADATIRVGLTDLAVEIVPDAVTQISAPPLAPAAVVPGDGASAGGPPEPGPGQAVPASSAPPDKRDGRRRGKSVLLALPLALLLVAGGAALGYSLTRADTTTTRAFVGGAKTAVLTQAGPVVTLVGVVQARPIGQMTVIIQRQVLARPFPGGPPVGLILNISFSTSNGAFKADVIGTVQITKTGGEIVRGAGTAFDGSGRYEDVQGSFTIAGDNGRGTISRFRLNGTLEY